MKHLKQEKQHFSTEKYCYLIIEKLSDEATGEVTEEDKWPRVLHSAPRARHVKLHCCLPDGSIRQMALTKNKHGK